MPASITRPHGKREGFSRKVKLGRHGERGEFAQGWTTREKEGSEIQSAEEEDTAWNASRVPASLHATTRHREGSRRRVYPGGLGEREQGWTASKIDRSDIPALKRKTQLGTPPVCQRHFTRPHGTGRVPDAESIREGVESVNKKLESMRERAARPKSTEEGDIAWSASRVPASLHATTWHREGSRRRVYLGGRGKFEQGPLGVKSVARRNIRATLHGTTAP